jgi:hypothetical protein
MQHLLQIKTNNFKRYILESSKLQTDCGYIYKLLTNLNGCVIIAIWVASVEGLFSPVEFNVPKNACRNDDLKFFTKEPT